jgi:hypothetical protein
MKTKAYINGIQDGEKGIENNFYKMPAKRIEYDAGFKIGMQTTIQKYIKSKPQLFHNSMSKHNKTRMTIIISGGSVQDVVRENTNCELVIHDYDMDGVNVELDADCKQDVNGKWYREVAMI